MITRRLPAHAADRASIILGGCVKEVMKTRYRLIRRGSRAGALYCVDTTTGKRTRHFDEAKRINATIKNLGPTLMQLTSTAVYRCAPQDDPAVVLKGSPIRSLTQGDYLVGTFRHNDGRRAVLLNNYHFAYSAWPTVVFDAPTNSVLEVNPVQRQRRGIDRRCVPKGRFRRAFANRSAARGSHPLP